MSKLDELVEEFTEHERDLKHISPSHLEAWIAQRDGEPVADPLKSELVRRGLWRPWPPPRSHRLLLKTEPATEDYRLAGEVKKTLTLNSTSLLLCGFRFLPLAVVAAFLPAYSSHPMLPILIGLVVLFGIPYLLQAIRSLRRCLHPDRVLMRGEQIVRLRKGADERLERSKILYLEVGHQAEAKVSRAMGQNPIGRAIQFVSADMYAVYAVTTDDEVVILSDYLDLDAARASVLVLEVELGLVAEPTKATRVRAPEATSTEEEAFESADTEEEESVI